MKILALNPIKTNNNQQYHIQNSAQKRSNTTVSGVYNPIYYKDYGVKINFGKRSPEDFYSQDFNRENMPQTMKNYLNANYTERSKIAPVQIMQEAFDGLECASTVDDIKELFPDETKFAKLKPANYKNATQGVMRKIKDIKSMQDAPETLFKNGCDDLTTYLVKKIYLEGKTVKEIDKDFAKDINPIYELAAKVPAEKAKTLGKNESAYFSHATIYNLGIRFPELPFWNSFIATRDDYERVRRVKTSTGEFVNADSAEGRKILQNREAAHQQQKVQEKPRKYNFHRENVKKATEAIINSPENTQKAFKEAKRRNKNIEELTFLQKYWSQIMSVAAEKIHLSEELIDFNAKRNSEELKLQSETFDKLITGEDLTKREKTPLKIFWNERPDLKGHFSNAITDTAMMFTDYFGADGENPEFKALLKYAQDIKPNREAAKLEHAKIQAEYDELAKTLSSQLQPEEISRNNIEEVKQFIQDAKQPIFKYNINGQEVITSFDIKKRAYELYDEAMSIIPQKFKRIYMNELEKLIADDSERFYLTCCFERSDETPDINDAIYPESKQQEINNKMIATLDSHYNKEIQASRIAMLDFAHKNNTLTLDEIKQCASSDLIYIQDIMSKSLNETEESKTAAKTINNAFNELIQPLTAKEKIQIRHKLFHYINDYDPGKTAAPNTSVPALLTLISDAMKTEPAYTINMKKLLEADTLYNFEGPFLRYILKPEAPQVLKNLVAEHAMKFLVYINPGSTAVMATSNYDKFTKLMSAFPKEMLDVKAVANEALSQVISKSIKIF